MRLVLGVDEAGRGPLAGPVAVGVVAAPEGFDFAAAFPGLNDSKQLSEPVREDLYKKLESPGSSIRYHVELVSHRIIDARGITYAVRHGTYKGIRKLLEDPAKGKIWLDGLLKAPRQYEQETVIGGDALVPAIMLASVAAKVTRDRYMKRLAMRYPAYGFEAHKGYGTRAHYEALETYGTCALHRLSYVHLDRRPAKEYTMG